MPGRQPPGAAVVAVTRGLSTWPAAEDDVDRRAGLAAPAALVVIAAVAPVTASEPSRPDVVEGGGVADDDQAVIARRWTA